MMNEEEIGIIVVSSMYLVTILYALCLALKQNRKKDLKLNATLLKFVKINLIIFITLIGIFAIISNTNYLDYEKPIEFSSYNDITFQNFRGIELFKKTLYNNPHFAYIVTSIEYEIYDDSLEVKSLFHPSKSYVYNQFTNSRDLLQHEKYHFKITELFARKIKWQVSKLESKDNNAIMKIINQNLHDERVFQHTYDDETFHSYVLSEQKRYEKNVDSILDLLSNYKLQKLSYEQH